MAKRLIGMTQIGAAVWDHGAKIPGLHYMGKQAMATAKLVIKSHRTIDGIASARAVPLYVRNKDIEAVNRGSK